MSSPICGSWPDLYYFLTVTVLFLWGAFSDERISLFLYMLLALASVMFLKLESLGTRDHLLLSQIREFPFRLHLRLAGPRWRYLNLLPHEWWTELKKSKLCYDRRSVGVKHPSKAYDQIFITVRQLQVCWCGALSLTRVRVCRLLLLLILARAVILGSEPLKTHNHILLSHVRNFPNLESQVPVFTSSRNRVAQLYPRHCVPFRRLLRFTGL
jgi:hypothetical protein